MFRIATQDRTKSRIDDCTAYSHNPQDHVFNNMKGEWKTIGGVIRAAKKQYNHLKSDKIQSVLIVDHDVLKLDDGWITLGPAKLIIEIKGFTAPKIFVRQPLEFARTCKVTKYGRENGNRVGDLHPYIDFKEVEWEYLEDHINKKYSLDLKILSDRLTHP